MEIILIVLTSTLLTGIIVAIGTVMFFIGFKKGQKNDGVEINKANAESIKQISDWLGYKGVK